MKRIYVILGVLLLANIVNADWGIDITNADDLDYFNFDMYGGVTYSQSSNYIQMILNVSGSVPQKGVMYGKSNLSFSSSAFNYYMSVDHVTQPNFYIVAPLVYGLCSLSKCSHGSYELSNLPEISIVQYRSPAPSNMYIQLYCNGVIEGNSVIISEAQFIINRTTGGNVDVYYNDSDAPTNAYDKLGECPLSTSLTLYPVWWASNNLSSAQGHQVKVFEVNLTNSSYISNVRFFTHETDDTPIESCTITNLNCVNCVAGQWSQESAITDLGGYTDTITYYTAYGEGMTALSYNVDCGSYGINFNDSSAIVMGMSGTQTIDISLGDDLSLGANKSMCFLAEDTYSEPIQDIFISLNDIEGNYYSCITNASGECCKTVLPCGYYRIRGWSDSEYDITVFEYSYPIFEDGLYVMTFERHHQIFDINIFVKDINGDDVEYALVDLYLCTEPDSFDDSCVRIESKWTNESGMVHFESSNLSYTESPFINVNVAHVDYDIVYEYFNLNDYEDEVNYTVYLGLIGEYDYYFYFYDIQSLSYLPHVTHAFYENAKLIDNGTGIGDVLLYPLNFTFNNNKAFVNVVATHENYTSLNYYRWFYPESPIPIGLEPKYYISERHTIDGYTFNEDGIALQGINVLVNCIDGTYKTTFTNSSGKFAFNDLKKNAECELGITSSNYILQDTYIFVLVDNKTGYNMTLYQKSADYIDLDVFTFDEVTNQPTVTYVDGVRVTAIGVGIQTKVCTTNNNGRCTLSSLIRTQSYRIATDKDGYDSYSVSIQPVDYIGKTLEMPLYPESGELCRISGKVYAKMNYTLDTLTPVSMKVELYDEQGNFISSMIANNGYLFNVECDNIYSIQGCYTDVMCKEKSILVSGINGFTQYDIIFDISEQSREDDAKEIIDYIWGLKWLMILFILGTALSMTVKAWEGIFGR